MDNTFKNTLYVFHQNKYLFTIFYDRLNFSLKNIVESEQGIIENFSYQFEQENIFLIDVDISSKYPECNVHVQYENTYFSNFLEYFSIEIRRVGTYPLVLIAQDFFSVGDLKKRIAPLIPPNQIELTYNGILMNNDNLKIRLYGINQPCIIYMMYRLGHKDYQIKRQSPPPKPKILTDKRLTCCVCFNNSSQYMFSPCNHLCVCSNCKKKIEISDPKCPICRMNYKKIEKVFY